MGRQYKPLYSRKEAAKLIGVSPKTISRWKKQGKLNSNSEGMYYYSDLRDLIDERNQLIDERNQLSLNISQKPDNDLLLKQTYYWEISQEDMTDFTRLSSEMYDLLSEQIYELKKQLEDYRKLDLDWFKKEIEEAKIREDQAREREKELRQIIKDSLDIPRRKTNNITLRDRILGYLKEQTQPQTIKAVQEYFDLENRAAKEALGALVKRGDARRTERGVFVAISKTPLAPSSEPTAQVRPPPKEPAPETLLGRVLKHVRDATGQQGGRRGVRSWQVQKELGLTKRPGRELGKLVARGLLYRIQDGIFTANSPEASLDLGDATCVESDDNGAKSRS